MSSDSCLNKVATNCTSGFALGTMLGAVQATWTDAPAVMRNQSFPAIAKTLGIMTRVGTKFAMIGGVFVGVSCVAEDVRGKADFWNGVYGGLAAGQMFGMQARSLSAGVGMGVAFAVASAAADATGHKVRPTTLFDDGDTPARIIYPYKSRDKDNRVQGAR